jgi:hypothetical protein
MHASNVIETCDSVRGLIAVVEEVELIDIDIADKRVHFTR